MLISIITFEVLMGFFVFLVLYLLWEYVYLLISLEPFFFCIKSKECM